MEKEWESGGRWWGWGKREGERDGEGVGEGERVEEGMGEGERVGKEWERGRRGWGKREGERDGEGVGERVEIIFGFILVTFTTTRNSCKMKQLYFYPKIYLAAK